MAEFDMQQYLRDMRLEQKQDHEALTQIVAEGFRETRELVSAHETRIVVLDNFRRTTKWLAGTVLTCVVLPLLIYAITLVLY